MQIERGVIRIGAEIEVPQWTNGASNYSTAKQLVEQEYMIGPKEQWENTHTYHCNCIEGGCAIVRKGTVVDPPIVSMTYDATLPDTGAEYIVSPVLLGNNGLRHLESIFNTVTENAVWTRKLKDKKGRYCSPSVHLHVSATLKEQMSRNDRSDDVLHVLSLYSPELFLLADMADVRRGLTYRLPSRTLALNTPGGSHHAFVQVRRAVMGHQIYIEWRLFEAAYRNWSYLEGCAYLAASFTRALLESNTFEHLMAVGYQHTYPEHIMDKAVGSDDPSLLFQVVSPERLKVLREMIVGKLDDDHYGSQVVQSLFDKAEARI